jgi:hypothetical protein
MSGGFIGMTQSTTFRAVKQGSTVATIQQMLKRQAASLGSRRDLDLDQSITLTA